MAIDMLESVRLENISFKQEVYIRLHVFFRHFCYDVTMISLWRHSCHPRCQHNCSAQGVWPFIRDQPSNFDGQNTAALVPWCIPIIWVKPKDKGKYLSDLIHQYVVLVDKRKLRSIYNIGLCCNESQTPSDMQLGVLKKSTQQTRQRWCPKLVQITPITGFYLGYMYIYISLYNYISLICL